MREIRFRAVDKETNEIYDDDRLEADDSIIVTLLYGQLVAFYVSIGGDYEELILNQWTGLTDRNGKEIYEGDIVELLGETTEGFYRKDRFEIYWDDVNAQFALKRMDTLYLDLNMDLHEAVVVGNVFEMTDWDF